MGCRKKICVALDEKGKDWEERFIYTEGSFKRKGMEKKETAVSRQKNRNMGGKEIGIA